VAAPNSGHTPNDITTYSFLCGLLSLGLLWHGHVWGFVVLYVLSYVFDCMDGQLARAYNMVTRFGTGVCLCKRLAL
jgi:phosphatidylglycerophosphate synthase